MKLLVTGGTGYIGRALVQAAVARGHDVVVFARTAGSSGLPGRTVDGDVRDADAVARAMRGCEAVCHAAALVTVWRRRREDFDDVNVGGLRNVIAAAKACGVARIVYTSSFLALPPSDAAASGRWNDYQRTKVAAEQLAARTADEGAPIVRMYPGVVYGPGRVTEGNLVGRLLGDHLAGRLPGVIGPDRVWSFAFIGDVAEGHMTALERGRVGACYRLGGVNAPQMRAFELVREIIGRRLPRRIPYPVASVLAFAEESRVRLLGGSPLLTRGTLEIFKHDWALDSTDAIRELDYRITPLAEGIRATLASLGASPS